MTRRQRAGLLGLGVMLCALTGAQAASHAHAQSLAVLRGTGPGVSEALAADIDRALVHSLAEVAGIVDPVVSPSSFDDVQLVAGCEGFGRPCMASIAQSMKTQVLLIRRLGNDGAGTLTLELRLFRADDDVEGLVAQSSAPASDARPIVAAVPGLVRKLFGVRTPSETARAPAPVASQPRPSQSTASSPQSEPEPTAAAERDSATPSAVRPLTWLALIGGAVTLGVGVAVSASAQSSFDDFEQMPVRSQSDADALHSQLDSIHTRGTIGNVLMPVGGAALAVGIVLLVLDFSRDDDARADNARLDDGFAHGFGFALGSDRAALSYHATFEATP